MASRFFLIALLSSSLTFQSVLAQPIISPPIDSQTTVSSPVWSGTIDEIAAHAMIFNPSPFIPDTKGFIVEKQSASDGKGNNDHHGGKHRWCRGPICRKIDNLLKRHSKKRHAKKDKQGNNNPEKDLQKEEFPLSQKVSNTGTGPAISSPTSPTPTVAVATQIPNFTAVTFSESYCFPPDSMGVVGPTQYVAFCNGRLKSFNKVTGVADGVLNINPDVFFSSVMTPGGFSSDPRIRYDRLSQSWFLIMIDVPPTNVPNRIMLAVTNSPTITKNSVWTFYSFQTVNDYGNGIVPFADFPTLGVDSNALYIGANIFDWNLGFINSACYVIRKDLLLNHVLNVTQFSKLLDPVTYEGPFAPQGVDNFNKTSNLGYIIGVDGAYFARASTRFCD